MELIRDIKNLSNKDTDIAGGKGASLGEMTQAGILVPGGFVILSSAFEKFLEETDLNVEIDSILRSVNHKEIHTVETASEKIKSLMISKDIPENIKRDIKKYFKKLNTKFVAVRSSATAEDSSSAAWAGQLESYLNTTENNLLENIKKCWASLFTPRAIFYRFEKGLHKQSISVAVVVQKMVDSKISGIAFSVHPITQDENQLIIEAGFGLGEAIVSGQITPDSYVVEKKSLKFIDININTQLRGLFRNKTGGNKWKEFSKIKGGGQVLSDNQIRRLSGIILSIEKHYNFPCDVEWALEKNKFYIVQSRPITTLGKRKEYPEATPIDFKNKKWVNYGTSAWPAYITPFAIVPSKKFGKVYGISNDVVAIWKGKSLDWLFDERQLVEFARSMLPRIIKKKWDLYDNWQVKVKLFDKLHYQLFNTNLSHISDKEFRDWIEKYYEYFVEQYAANDFIEPLSIYFQNHLQRLLTSEGMENGEAKKLIGLYSTPSKPNYIQQCIEEYNKAKSKKRVADVLKKFHYINNDYTGSQAVTKRDLEKLVAKNPHFSGQIDSSEYLPSKIKDLLTVLQMTATIQDVRKAESLMWVTGAEKLLRELSRRQDIPIEELLLATWDEIIANKYDRNELKRRRKHCVVYWQSKDTKIWSGHEANQIISDFKRSIIGDTKNMQEFKGVSASEGRVKGRAAVVLNRNQIRKVKKGDILIAVATRPEYMPVMRLAAAFVTDEGGITSHAAIVAREMKKPCVIATKMASKVIKDGDMLEVDADKGVVRIIDNREERKFSEKRKGKFKFFVDVERMNLFPYYLAEESLTDDIEKIFNKKIDKTLLEFKKNHLYYYLDPKQFHDIGELLFEKARKDKKFYKIVEKNILKTGMDLLNFCSRIGKFNFSKISNGELARIYNEYSKKLKTIRAWGWVPQLMDGIETAFLSNFVQEKLRQFLKSINKENKFSEYYSILSSSEKMSEIKIEEISRLKLIQRVKKIDRNLIKILNKNADDFIDKAESIPDISDEIKSHAKKFRWLTFGYIGPAMNETDVVNLMRDSLKQKISIENQIEDIGNHYSTLKQKKKNIIDKIKLPNELKYLFRISAFFMHLKDLRKGIYQKSYVAMDPVLEEISRRLDLTLEEVRFLIQDEISEALNKGKDFSDIVKQRKNYCVAITESGTTKVFHGKKAKEIIIKETYKDQIDTKVKQIKGMIAYSGKVTGIAKIVSVVNDIKKIKKGEILVSHATNPDLILAMKKASAFITDMGGITSHAAIVSREMKKPCIVGTLIATKVIRDGDRIEVDANNGIIKILNK